MSNVPAAESAAADTSPTIDGTTGELAHPSAINDPQARLELQHEFIRYARVQHALRGQLLEVLPTGLDPAAAQLLVWLIKQGSSRQGELAEETYLAPSTVSRRIRQLVNLGLAERRADPADGRAVQILPTAAGQAFFATMRARRGEIMAEVMAHWSDTEIADLSRLMCKLNDDFEFYRGRRTAPSPPTASS